MAYSTMLMAIWFLLYGLVALASALTAIPYTGLVLGVIAFVVAILMLTNR